MAKNFEKELKYGLSKRDFEKLFAASKRRKTKTQINTYFDTSDQALRKIGAGLRVRIEDDKRAYLTLKCATPQTAASVKRGRHLRREWECRLELREAKRLRARKMRMGALKSPVHRRIEALIPGVAERVRVIGTVITRRSPIRLGPFHAELDAWRVGKRKFYELELETTALAQAEKTLREHFRSLGIRAKPRASTKLAAVFQSRPPA